MVGSPEDWNIPVRYGVCRAALCFLLLLCVTVPFVELQCFSFYSMVQYRTALHAAFIFMSMLRIPWVGALFSVHVAELWCTATPWFGLCSVIRFHIVLCYSIEHFAAGLLCYCVASICSFRSQAVPFCIAQQFFVNVIMGVAEYSVSSEVRGLSIPKVPGRIRPCISPHCNTAFPRWALCLSCLGLEGWKDTYLYWRHLQCY